MKKLVALFLAGVMAAALPASAFAATLTFKGAAKEEPEKKTLTLKGKDESKASSGKGLTLQGSSGVSTLGAANSAQATVQALGIVPKGASLSAKVTRGDFARMLTLASVYKDSVTGSAGLSLYPDVKQDHPDSGYIKVAVANGWMSAYLDGTFRPEDKITWEEAATALLKLLGYSTADLIGAYPAAQINKAAALGLADGLTKKQGQTLTNQECVSIFYHLLEAKTQTGAVYASTLGYTLNSDGSVNYLAVISGDLEGPYVVSSSSKWKDILPFALSEATLYYNGSSGKSSQVSQYDVVYYNANSKTVWVYNKKVSGLITAIAPGGLNPTTVTLLGETYQVSSSTAAYKLSSMGSYHTGDVATLIRGMNNDVVDVISSAKDSGLAYGIITNVQTISYKDEDGGQTTAELITLLDDTGTAQQFVNTGDFYDISFGPAAIRYSGVKVKELELLSEVELEHIGGRRDVTAVDGTTYEVGANAAVFLSQNGSYSSTTLSSVSKLSGYTITGYYDDVLKGDGKLYVIIAQRDGM